MPLIQEPPKNPAEKTAQDAAKLAFEAIKSAVAGAPKMAARLTDHHACPQVLAVVPHSGGPISGPGITTVLIAGQPASVVGDACTCNGPADKVVAGSGTVLIGGKAAARLGDPTDHSGTIDKGEATVLIGD